MPCYPCSHCNKCGIFSIQLEVFCNTCGATMVIGESVCPECGTPYAGNTSRGKMGKPEGTDDYYTRMNEDQGLDAHRMVDMSNFERPVVDDNRPKHETDPEDAEEQN